MDYKFSFTKKAEKDLQKLDQKTAKIVVKKLIWYSRQKNPIRYSIKMQEPKTGDIRFRIGDYRAIAVIDENKYLILIVKIEHRGRVYR